MAFWNRKDKEEPPQGTPAPAPVVAEEIPVPLPEGTPASLFAPPIMPVAEAEPEEKRGWLSRLTGGLAKSSGKLTQGLGDLVSKRKLDQAMLDQLEEKLIEADLGPKVAARVVSEFGESRFGRDVSGEEVRAALAGSITTILAPVAKPLVIEKPADGPQVILVCGVNGVGKTTTIGKIAYNLAKQQNKRVMMAAGDTFRAAAREQLQIWGNRAGAVVYSKADGADSAALAYEAYAQAKAENADVLLIDTAGRLHNKSNLMEELRKIVRVLKKHDETLPHTVLLVLDATTGQNAHEQVRVFQEMVAVSGLVVTKLDGTAKGGVVVSLADRFALPIHLVGVGETAEDLQPFTADGFAKALVETR